MSRYVTAFLFIVVCMPVVSQAADSTPLARLAAQYHGEVKAFEKTVIQIRGIDRFDERLVDRWDDETARLSLAAKNPRHFNRLFHQWQAVSKLEAQAEAAIFGKYTPHHDLIGQFERVLYARQLFVEEFILHVENPTHIDTVRRLDRPSARRSSYLPKLAN
ncbi:hypothetical protein [Rubripirellula reticaptiva]|uniref:DUF4142 domain-containing protein n=1 Tax=Rubripirellula reticaptiva TaxID=2528013 RepID=A0A5C6F6X0_9BACT|nr:hypothetical protein [Rubripirellula reticaptiva]TWU57453.1 hypothetical protein Poly59_03600 [Rubripirellula reticaptiva]